jgi:hypothetical protein
MTLATTPRFTAWATNIDREASRHPDDVPPTVLRLGGWDGSRPEEWGIRPDSTTAIQIIDSRREPLYAYAAVAGARTAEELMGPNGAFTKALFRSPGVLRHDVVGELRAQGSFRERMIWLMGRLETLLATETDPALRRAMATPALKAVTDRMDQLLELHTVFSPANFPTTEADAAFSSPAAFLQHGLGTAFSLTLRTLEAGTARVVLDGLDEDHHGVRRLHANADLLGDMAMGGNAQLHGAQQALTGETDPDEAAMSFISVEAMGIRNDRLRGRLSVSSRVPIGEMVVPETDERVADLVTRATSRTEDGEVEAMIDMITLGCPLIFRGWTRKTVEWLAGVACTPEIVGAGLQELRDNGKCPHSGTLAD